MLKNQNDQIKSLWHAKQSLEVGNIGLEEHKSLDVFSTEASSAADQLFVFIMMTLFG